MANLEISRGQRLDQRVLELVPQISRAFAGKLIEEGKVTVNGNLQMKSGYKLRDGDEVEVEFSMEEATAIPDIDLPVLYEDDDCVVIDKPIGVLSHSKGAFNPEATVESWLRSKTKIGGARAGIVHRLDRATSGVMICAKTPEALSWLQKQFSQRKTKKTYIAVISGHLQLSEAIIDLPVERNPKAPATFRVGPNGKAAKTTYKVLRENDDYSLVELRPETGRTHQLRVHMAHLGHPIVGDTMYDGPESTRMMLHARELELTLPSRERKVVTSPLPDSFETMVGN